MTESLRPMNLGGILDHGVQVFRARFAVFFGLASITGIAQLAFRLGSVHPGPSTAVGPMHGLLVFASYAATFVTWLASTFLEIVVPASICLAASRVNLGEEVSIHEAFNAFTPKFWRLFGLGLLQAIFAGWPFIIAAIIAVIVAGALASSGGVAVVVVVIYVLGGIPSLALYTRYALALPATAIEGLTASSAIDRSVSLSEGGRWRIFWGIVVPSVPSLGLVFGVSGLLEALKSGNALLASNPLLVAGINGVVALITTLVFTPYGSIVLTLLYYDQRIRKEGFDVERMMHAAGLDEGVGVQAGVQ
jgi:hypothetical protein